MKSHKKILAAFLLNLFFSFFEIAGGILTGSVAIISDAIHDFGDAAAIGISYGLEKKSKRKPDMGHTYGYARYSVLGSAITTFILLFSSCTVICNAVMRIFRPTTIHYDGMILFAVVGVVINGCAAFFTSGGHSLNQKAVNLHMLEDVLGWVVVLIGAVVMRFTNFFILDPLMSLAVAVFILLQAWKQFRLVIDLFLEKTPEDIDPEQIRTELLEIPGVSDVHHIHIRSIDGLQNSATMHVVAEGPPCQIKDQVRQILFSHNVVHMTLELEAVDEPCNNCGPEMPLPAAHFHRHHHHRHAKARN